MATTSLFGPSPAELILAQQKEAQQEQLLRNQMIAQQGAEFGPFRGLYQAGLRFGDVASQAAMQGLFPQQMDPRLQEATAVQSVLSKYSGEDQSDPKILEKIGKDLMSVAPNAGLKALSLSRQLEKEKKETFTLLNKDQAKSLGLPEGGTYQVSSSGKVDVITQPDKGEGTQFERVLATIPEEQRQAYRLSWLRKQTEGSGMPASLIPIALKEADNISNIAFGVGEVGTVIKDLQSGTLKLGLTENFANQLKTLAGKSDEGSRAFSRMNTTLETLRNARLNLNVGVQTEGDAVRAANEFLANFDKYDTKTALTRLQDVERKLSNAYQSKQNRLSGLYSQYGTPLPKEFFPKIGVGAEPSKSGISDEVIRREFNDPKNAAWKSRGFDEFKKKFLELNP
jgi:hypothetical protein